MNNFYKSLLDFAIISFLKIDSDFIQEIILMILVIVINCIIIPLIRKLLLKINDKYQLNKKDEINEGIKEIEDKIDEKTKK